MTNKGWEYEKNILLVIATVCFALGWLTSYWSWCIVLCLVICLIWHIKRIKTLENWLREGAQAKEAPHLFGLYGDSMTHVIKSKKRMDKRRYNMQKVVRLFDRSAQNAPDATIVVNANKEIVWMNKAARKDLKLRKKRDVGIRINSVWRDPEFSKFIDHMSFNEPHTFESPVEEGRFFDIRLSPYFNGGVMITARDITRMVLADKMRRDFVSNASHELKTPLTVMMGYLEMLEAEPSIDHDLQPVIKSASMQANRMHALLNDLLSLSRLESSEIQCSDTVFVSSMVLGIVEDAKLMPEYDHTIKTNLDDDLVIKGDYQDLLSAFSNLVFNAVLHTLKGTVIEISWARASDSAIFCVKDYGEGVEDVHVSRLTERFYRVEQGRERSDNLANKGRGTGLGLAIVKHVVQRHGGVLNIKSKLGEGSEFCCIFTLPNKK